MLYLCNQVKQQHSFQVKHTWFHCYKNTQFLRSLDICNLLFSTRTPQPSHSTWLQVRPMNSHASFCPSPLLLCCPPSYTQFLWAELSHSHRMSEVMLHSCLAYFTYVIQGRVAHGQMSPFWSWIAFYCENAAHFLYPVTVATVRLIPEHSCSAEIDLGVTISFWQEKGSIFCFPYSVLF